MNRLTTSIASHPHFKGTLRTSLVAAAVAAIPSVALAAPRESVTFTNVKSQGVPGTEVGATQNEIRSASFVGGYPVHSIRVTATLRVDVTGTAQHEARLLVTPPVGKPFVLMPSRVTPLPSLGASFTYTDYVFPLNTPIADAAGSWSFRFFEQSAQSTTQQDATWTSIQLTLDDAFTLRSTAQTLTANGPGIYQEAEPNDDAFLTPNVIDGMLPGQTITGTIAGSVAVTDPGLPSSTPSATVDTFVIRTAPVAPTFPPTIYRYTLTLDSQDGEIIGGNLLGSTQNTYSSSQFVPPLSGQNYIQIGGGGRGSMFGTGNVEYVSLQAGYGVNGIADPHARVNQWDGFGRGERVVYRLTQSGSNPTPHPYTVTLARQTVTPIALGTPLPPGPVTFTASIHNDTPSAFAWRCVLFDANLNEIPDAQSKNDCAFSTSTPMTRVLTEGTYYLAVADSPFSAMTSQTAPAGDNCSSFMDATPFYPDSVLSASSTAGPLRFVVTLTDSNDDPHMLYCPNPSPTDPCVKTTTLNVMWYTFTVGTPGTQGVCCRGSTCTTAVGQADCTAASPAGAAFINSASACNNSGNALTPCCYADFDHSGTSNVQDIFSFLNSWFASSVFARVGGDGSTGAPEVQDIFSFLNAWFSGGC